MGKVYRKDGRYLVRSESHTHTGFHTRFEWVDDVNNATVFYGDHGERMRKLVEASAGADALEATETRTVTIAP